MGGHIPGLAKKLSSLTVRGLFFVFLYVDEIAELIASS